MLFQFVNVFSGPNVILFVFFQHEIMSFLNAGENNSEALSCILYCTKKAPREPAQKLLWILKEIEWTYQRNADSGHINNQ